MTLGEGIFWSSIVLVSFASIGLITKHKKWKLILKILISLIITGATIGAIVYFYNKYQNRAQKMMLLNGIKLGMSEVEVTLSKGKPDHILQRDKPQEGYRKVYLYKNASDSFLHVTFRNLDSIKVTDICEDYLYTKILGIGKYSSEDDVIEKFGKPSLVSIIKDGTRKYLSYAQWNVAFEIEKGSVIQLCVSDNPQWRYAEEYEQETNK